jgi:hypothetical protein
MASHGNSVCPMCGATIDGSAQRCLSCGEELRLIAPESRLRWITDPSPRMTYLIGGVTIWTVMYYCLFIPLFLIGIVVQVRTGVKADIDDRWLWILAPLHLGTIVLGFGLLAYYAIFLFRSERFTTTGRIIWLSLFLCLGGFSMLPFFLFYVRPLRAKCRSASDTASPAGA